MANLGLHAIISSELLAGLLGMFSAIALAENIAQFLQALLEDQIHKRSHSLVQHLRKRLSRKDYRSYESLAGSIGQLFIALDIIFVKQINFLLFFAYMTIPLIGYYLLFPRLLYAPNPCEFSETKDYHAILANKIGYGLVFWGVLMTLATAYLQYKYYSLLSIKGGVFTAMGVLLLTTSVCGWVISATASRSKRPSD